MDKYRVYRYEKSSSAKMSLPDWFRIDSESAEQQLTKRNSPIVSNNIHFHGKRVELQNQVDLNNWIFCCCFECLRTNVLLLNCGLLLEKNLRAIRMRFQIERCSSFEVAARYKNLCNYRLLLFFFQVDLSLILLFLRNVSIFPSADLRLTIGCYMTFFFQIWSDFASDSLL